MSIGGTAVLTAPSPSNVLRVWVGDGSTVFCFSARPAIFVSSSLFLYTHLPLYFLPLLKKNSQCLHFNKILVSVARLRTSHSVIFFV